MVAFCFSTMLKVFCEKELHGGHAQSGIRPGHYASRLERVVYKRKIFGDEGNLDSFNKDLKDTTRFINASFKMWASPAKWYGAKR
jgi:hypothetical protein